MESTIASNPLTAWAFRPEQKQIFPITEKSFSKFSSAVAKKIKNSKKKVEARENLKKDFFATHAISKKKLRT